MARRARYRVTLNGFRVLRETWDHVLEVDGKRDEVFVVWRVAANVSGGGYINDSMTPVMGDVGTGNPFPGRLQAGTASSRGGLRTGDSVPDTTAPWRIDRAFGSTPPLVMWDGILEDGDRIAISPTVWEWDGVGRIDPKLPLQVTSSVLDAAAAVLATIPTGATQIAAAIVEVVAVIARAMSESLGVAGDRPIGMRLDAPTDQKFTALVISLTVPLAETLIATDYGRGPGVLSYQYQDPSEIGGGTYEIYYQITRVGVIEDDGAPIPIDPPDTTLAIDLKMRAETRSAFSIGGQTPLPPQLSALDRFAKGTVKLEVVDKWDIKAHANVRHYQGGVLHPSEFVWLLDGAPVQTGPSPDFATKLSPDGQSHELRVFAVDGQGRALVQTRTFSLPSILRTFTVSPAELTRLGNKLKRMFPRRQFEELDTTMRTFFRPLMAPSSDE